MTAELWFWKRMKNNTKWFASREGFHHVYRDLRGGGYTIKEHKHLLLFLFTMSRCSSFGRVWLATVFILEISKGSILAWSSVSFGFPFDSAVLKKWHQMMFFIRGSFQEKQCQNLGELFFLQRKMWEKVPFCPSHPINAPIYQVHVSA